MTGKNATDKKLAAVQSVSQDPKSVVEAFFEALESFDYDRALALVDEDCVYKNVPFHTARGKARISRDLNSMSKTMNLFEVEMVNIAVNGNVVLTERVDTLGAKLFKVAVPLMGVLVVEHGKITEWRDYFDWSFCGGKILKSVVAKPFGFFR